MRSSYADALPPAKCSFNIPTQFCSLLNQSCDSFAHDAIPLEREELSFGLLNQDLFVLQKSKIDM